MHLHGGAPILIHDVGVFQHQLALSFAVLPGIVSRFEDAAQTTATASQGW